FQVSPYCLIYFRIYLDGPYGTASDGVTQYSVSVLIGCGIGVTPFASVLRDVWHQAGKTRSLRKLKRLYFYWICPDCRAFEWFAALLQDLERDLQRMDGDDYAQLLDIRVHLTGSVETRQAREIASREGDEADCLTGLRTRTHYGRPNWDLELRDLAAKHPE
uniref:NAD_binding_6 domain-containing protein n=1 Tax=Macrostomum lignano TaxID=282301 RepID=A0A1I8H0Z0_9PLAT